MAKTQKLPVPGKGRDLEIHEKILIADHVCQLYELGAHPLTECLRRYGIKSDSTWVKWRNEIEEIEERYKNARELLQETLRLQDQEQRLRIRHKALDSLEQSVEGHVIELKEEEVIPEHTDGDGNKRPRVILKTKIKEVYVKPVPMLIMYSLNNLDGHNFTRNPEPYQAGNERIPEKIQIEIIGGELPPVTKEEDIIDPTE